MPASQKYSDDVILGWVRDRAAGMSLKAIADSHGVNYGYVNAATARIKKEDIAHSGEPAAVVRGAYW
jgi:1,2-phenylacetyl-CoA epoxidase catalytic subunit